MDDLISRASAIDALADYIHNVDKVMGALANNVDKMMGVGTLSAYDCKQAQSICHHDCERCAWQTERRADE